MPDYGHDLLFGVNLVPTADRADALLATARYADAAGLELLGVQDHPYQPRFLDTWTLLSVIAARTTRIRVFPDVVSLPMRPPAVLARSAAALDILSGGRVELGLGAGAFWDAIAAMGGPRRTPGESIAALAEAIEVIRALWAPGRGVRVAGTHYRLDGAKPGPAPAHDIGIWVGAYKQRMLQLTGRSADGWIPSSPHAPPEQLAAMSRVLDDAAESAGRSPRAVRRLYNLAGSFTGDGTEFLQGPPKVWVEQLAELAVTEGISGFVLLTESDTDLRRFAEEVAPAVRELVTEERAAGTRVDRVEPEPAPGGNGRHLVEVHDHLRAELAQVRDLVDQVAAGALGIGAARSAINTMTMRQNNWTLGTYCESYCRLLTTHHTLEDQAMFPRLREAEPELGPVIDRLEREHEGIAEVLERVDAALVALVGSPGGLDAVRDAVDELGESLLAHLSYEEQQLVGPLDRMPGGLV